MLWGWQTWDAAQLTAEGIVQPADCTGKTHKVSASQFLLTLLVKPPKMLGQGP